VIVKRTHRSDTGHTATTSLEVVEEDSFLSRVRKGPGGQLALVRRFIKADTYSLGFSEKELKHLVALFKRECDDKRNETISREKFMQIISFGNSTHVKDQEEISLLNILFDNFDRDNDNKLNLREFLIGISFWKQLSSSADDKIVFFFNLFDKDRDGKLTKEEFSSMMYHILSSEMYGQTVSWEDSGKGNDSRKSAGARNKGHRSSSTPTPQDRLGSPTIKRLSQKRGSETVHNRGSLQNHRSSLQNRASASPELQGALAKQFVSALLRHTAKGGGQEGTEEGGEFVTFGTGKSVTKEALQAFMKEKPEALEQLGISPETLFSSFALHSEGQARAPSSFRGVIGGSKRPEAVALSREEMLGVIQSTYVLNGSLPPVVEQQMAQYCDQVFESCDIDADGQIDLVEFRLWLQNNGHLGEALIAATSRERNGWQSPGAAARKQDASGRGSAANGAVEEGQGRGLNDRRQSKRFSILGPKSVKNLAKKNEDGSSQERDSSFRVLQTQVRCLASRLLAPKATPFLSFLPNYTHCLNAPPLTLSSSCCLYSCRKVQMDVLAIEGSTLSDGTKSRRGTRLKVKTKRDGSTTRLVNKMHGSIRRSFRGEHGGAKHFDGNGRRVSLPEGVIHHGVPIEL
jgi:Ca2+-binding EF-hand superfamily protein